MCREDVENLIFHVDGKSVARAILEGLVDKSQTQFRMKKVWDMLKEGDGPKTWTLERDNTGKIRPFQKAVRVSQR